MAESIHYVKYVHETDGYITAKFECRGDLNSDCHKYPECGCEGICSHERTSHAECGYLWSLREDCGSECHVNCKQDEKVRSGPIDVRWNGDCVEWEYA